MLDQLEHGAVHGVIISPPPPDSRAAGADARAWPYSLSLLGILEKTELRAAIGPQPPPGLDEHVFIPEGALMADAIEAVAILRGVDADQAEGRW